MNEKTKSVWQRYGILAAMVAAILVGLVVTDVYLQQMNTQLVQEIKHVHVDKREAIPASVSDKKAQKLTDMVNHDLNDLLDGKASVTNQSTLNSLTGIFLQTGKVVPTLKQTETQRKAYFSGFKFKLNSTGAIQLQTGYHLIGRLTSTFRDHRTEAGDSIVDFGLDSHGLISSVQTYTVQPESED